MSGKSRRDFLRKSVAIRGGTRKTLSIPLPVCSSTRFIQSLAVKIAMPEMIILLNPVVIVAMKTLNIRTKNHGSWLVDNKF
ncbi:MAG: hypothetical protein HY800_09975 [Ignavibacteriales bacterium]|nr:hypothetical protein [Ignavibacteriales bacterium]